MNATPTITPLAAVRVLQIITFAMVAGVLTYAGFTLFARKFAFDGEPNLICWIAIGFASAAVMLHIVVPKITMGTQLRMLKTQDLSGLVENEKFLCVFPVYQTGHIVACALLEGAAFFNLFAYQSAGYVWNLATALILVALMLLRFPTLNSSEFWVQDRLMELETVR